MPKGVHNNRTHLGGRRPKCECNFVERRTCARRAASRRFRLKHGLASHGLKPDKLS